MAHLQHIRHLRHLGHLTEPVVDPRLDSGGGDGPVLPNNYVEFNSAGSVTLPVNVQVIGGGITNILTATGAEVIGFELISGTSWPATTITDASVSKVVVQDVTNITGNLTVRGVNTTLVDFRNTDVTGNVDVISSAVSEVRFNSADIIDIRNVIPSGGTLDVYGDSVVRVEGDVSPFLGTNLNLNLNTVGNEGIRLQDVTTLQKVTSTITSCSGVVFIQGTTSLNEFDFSSCTFTQPFGMSGSSVQVIRVDNALHSSGLAIGGANPTGGTLDVYGNEIRQMVGETFLGTELNLNINTIGSDGLRFNGNTNIQRITSTATGNTTGLTFFNNTTSLNEFDFSNLTFNNSVTFVGSSVQVIRVANALHSTGINVSGANPTGGTLDIYGNEVRFINGEGTPFLGDTVNVRVTTIGSSGVRFNDSPALTSVSFPNLTTKNGLFRFNGCSLTQASMNLILNQMATNNGGGIVNIGNRTLDLSGGTNASPTGGVSNADYLALVGAGWPVSIN